MKKLVLVIVSAAALSLAGCSGTAFNNQNVGTLAGGAIGGFLGNQIGGGSGKIIATVGGTLLGAFLGNQIGASMDKVDQMRVQQAMNSNAPTAWTGKNGTKYKVVPGPQAGNCRPYTVYAYMNGQKTPINGTACQQPNGQWVATN